MLIDIELKITLVVNKYVAMTISTFKYFNYIAIFINTAHPYHEVLTLCGRPNTYYSTTELIN